MRKFILIALLCAGFWSALSAQAEPEQTPLTIEDLQAQIQAMSDSLLQFREREIFSEYGFRDSDRLSEVAAKLGVEDIPRWKKYLDLEPDNASLDAMSLRELGISPYRAFLAQQYSVFGFTELSTLSELAWQKQLPLKQVRQFAGIESTERRFDGHSLRAMGKTPGEFADFVRSFGAQRLKFGLTIALVGILIVFSSLAVTAIVISQLRHLNRKRTKDKSSIVLDASGKIVSHPQDLNSDIIAAAITALHLHKQSIEERRRLLLTFRRVRSNHWYGSGILSMPNREILRKRS